MDAPTETPRSLSLSLRVRLVELVSVAVVYYAAARLGLMLQLPGTNASPVWPPSGIGLAAVLIFGLRVWPAIAAAAFLANLLTLPSTSAGWFAAAAIGAGNTLEHVAALFLIRYFIPSSKHPFERTRDVFWFLIAAGTACVVACTIGASSLWLAGIIPDEIYTQVWFTWWLGDTAGMLVFAPVLVGWWLAPHLNLSGTRTLELVGVVGATAVLGWLIFGGGSRIALPYLVVPGLLWVAFRFGPRETATLSAVLAVIAIAATWQAMNASGRNFTPFSGPATGANESLLLLQVFVCAIAVTAVTLAAAVAERTESEGRLLQSEERFRTIFEQAAVGVALIDTATGQFVRVNERSCRMLGFSPAEMLSATFMAIKHSEDLPADLALMRRLHKRAGLRFAVER